LAQAEAFAFGHSEHAALAELVKRGMALDQAEQLARHKVHPGGRPVSLLVFEQLTPFVLGQLVALYEHQVYGESVLLDINPFDQWCVELGKAMALALEPALTGQNQIPLRADMQSMIAWMSARGLE
jgi:glucose-6-phosphate isomerase